MGGRRAGSLLLAGLIGVAVGALGTWTLLEDGEERPAHVHTSEPGPRRSDGDPVRRPEPLLAPREPTRAEAEAIAREGTLGEAHDELARNAERAQRAVEELTGQLREVGPTLAWLRELLPARYGSMSGAELVHLRELDLSQSEVTDPDLAQLAKLPALRRLGLRRTGITDEGLRHLARCERLETLGLRETQITDDGLAHLRDLGTLKRLDLNMTPVTDAGLAHVAALTGLTFLRLNYTKITDQGLVHLNGLRQLERLDLWGTAITRAPDRLAALTWLKHLELGATSVGRAWVEDFRAANPECTVRSRWSR